MREMNLVSDTENDPRRDESLRRILRDATGIVLIGATRQER